MDMIVRGFAAIPDRWTAAALAAAAVLVCSTIGSQATAPALVSWYPALAKPVFTPPNWLFPVAWTALFAAMAYASWLVWRASGRAARPALAIYGVNLALNALWSVAFFGFQSPAAGLVVLAPFLASIAATARAFRPHSVLAARLMLPYLSLGRVRRRAECGRSGSWN